jgi:hypothetical protein
MENAQLYGGLVSSDTLIMIRSTLIWGTILLACTSFFTILYLVFPGYRLLRMLVLSGAVPMLGFGISRILLAIRSTPFEGYMLLFGVTLILQFALAILTLAFVPDVTDSRLRL